MNRKDYYQILGVERGLSHQQIKEAYRRLGLEYEPDSNKGNVSTAKKMKEFNEAYAVLLMRRKESRYDSLNQE